MFMIQVLFVVVNGTQHRLIPNNRSALKPQRVFGEKLLPMWHDRNGKSGDGGIINKNNFLKIVQVSRSLKGKGKTKSKKSKGNLNDVSTKGKGKTKIDKGQGNPKVVPTTSPSYPCVNVRRKGGRGSFSECLDSSEPTKGKGKVQSTKKSKGSTYSPTMNTSSIPSTIPSTPQNMFLSPTSLSISPTIEHSSEPSDDLTSNINNTPSKINTSSPVATANNIPSTMPSTKQNLIISSSPSISPTINYSSTPSVELTPMIPISVTYHPSASSSVPSIVSTSHLPTRQSNMPVSTDPLICGSCEMKFAVNIINGDKYQEVSWLVRNETGDIVLQDDRSNLVTCLKSGHYNFTISNESGDGLCCASGFGFYEIHVNDGLVLDGGDFGFEETIGFTVMSPYNKCNDFFAKKDPTSYPSSIRSLEPSTFDWKSSINVDGGSNLIESRKGDTYNILLFVAVACCLVFFGIALVVYFMERWPSQSINLICSQQLRDDCSTFSPGSNMKYKQENLFGDHDDIDSVWSMPISSLMTETGEVVDIQHDRNSTRLFEVSSDVDFDHYSWSDPENDMESFDISTSCKNISPMRCEI